MKRLRTNLTYANVMATIAVFLVFAGGTAFAASHMLPKNSVGPGQLKKGAVTPVKLSKSSKATLVGPTGAAGQRGAQGPKGDRGDRGEVGPTGPSTIYAGFHDEQRQISALLPAMSTVVTLNGLPAGAYSIQAKFQAKSYVAATDFTECILVAETDFDAGYQYLGDAEYGDFTAPFALQLVHTFPTAGGEVAIKCGHSKNEGSGANLSNIKITAIKVGSIATNHFIE
jgi:hypothetical protein